MSVVTLIPWRLGPANPLLLRVVTAGGRRWRHALVRWIYLGLLICVLLLALLTASVGAASLSELAKAATRVFSYISFVQLSMICLLAPVFTAGAITQERDSRTYSILLSTPLSNGQIVLGTLLSRLYYIVVLLLSGVPVFAITLFYGGVTAQGIFLSFAIAMATAIFMGALAITIAVLRVGTARMVFWFYVFNAIYLVGVGMLDYYLPGAGSGVAASAGGHETTVITGIHPFLALRSVVNPTQYPVPDYSSVASHSWVVRQYLLHPVQAYLFITLSLSTLLVSTGTLCLRQLAQRAESSPVKRFMQMLLRKVGIGRQTRPARTVWKNPIAWREAQTRGGTLARGLTRWLAISVGITVTLWILWAYNSGILATAEEVRLAVLGLVLVEFSLTLLLAANTAAAAITREQETAVLDLYLVTPLTAKDYIQGKFWGIFWFLLPLLIVPTGVLAALVVADLATGRLFTEPIINPEVLIIFPIFTVVMTLLTCLLGLMCSLRWSRTMVSVMATVGVLAGLCGVLGVCGFATRDVPILGLIMNAFSPFTGLAVMIAPDRYAAGSLSYSGFTGGATGAAGVSEAEGTVRALLFVLIVVSSLIYAFIGRFMYRWLMRNFDLVLRRQRR